MDSKPTELKSSNPLACPFCGERAEESALWPTHYGCSDQDCGAYLANLALAKWNSRAPEIERLRAALERIAKYPEPSTGFTGEDAYEMRLQAREALAGWLWVKNG